MSHLNNIQLFSSTINVRIDDLNYGNHLCHSKFIHLIHNARALFLKTHGLSELNCYGYGLVMLHLEIDYLSQCFFNDQLEIIIALDQTERATFSLKYQVINHTSQKQAATAKTRMGFLDIDKGKLSRVPNEFKQLIASLSCG